MGEQTGVVRIRGTVGNLTFTKNNKVHLKSGIDGEIMRKDKRFRRTRENWSEFSVAAKAASLIRHAFADFTEYYRDPGGQSRLLSHTMKVVKSDPTSARGQRQIQLGNFSSLVGYDFNIAQPLKLSFKQPFAVSIDRTAGTAEVATPQCWADTSITEPYGATHFKFVACVAVINWEEKSFEKGIAESPQFEVGETDIPAQNLALSFTAETPHTILISLGTWFYQEANGENYMMRDGSNHAMAIVAVDHI